MVLKIDRKWEGWQDPPQYLEIEGQLYDLSKYFELLLFDEICGFILTQSMSQILNPSLMRNRADEENKLGCIASFFLRFLGVRHGVTGQDSSQVMDSSSFTNTDEAKAHVKARHLLTDFFSEHKTHGEDGALISIYEVFKVLRAEHRTQVGEQAGFTDEEEAYEQGSRLIDAMFSRDMTTEEVMDIVIGIVSSWSWSETKEVLTIT